MPSLNNYLKLAYVNLGFIAQIAVMMYFTSIIEIKENWPIYRCNPSYWIFSDNVSTDFTYCVQNSQVNIMGYLLQPMTYLISSIGNSGNELSSNVNGIRQMLSTIRNFTSSIVENVFGVFLNIITEFQKMVISIKDMVGKLIGVVVSIMYILDGSIKTMTSAWAGPTGQLVRTIGSCFHPDTKIRLKNGNIHAMKNIPLGAILEDGSSVFSVMKINNFDRSTALYKLNKGGVNNEPIYVTGEHYIFDINTNKFVQIKDYGDATKQTDINCDYFSCLITTSKHIPIGNYLFWDWEDDELKGIYYSNLWNSYSNIKDKISHCI